LAVAGSVTAGVVAALPAGADVRGDVRYDADFVTSMQAPSGAILADVTGRLVDPYVANYAAWGLARATRYTANPAYAAAALKWLIWYQDHMDAGGIVHDYTVVNRTLQATNDEDSVDATSGVFLLAAQEEYRAGGSGQGRAALDLLRPGIAKAVGAINSLRDADGLTWAKPSWRVKYLMDNSEAYAGLQAAVDLASAMGNPALAAAAAHGASMAQAGILTLWNPTTMAYDWAEHANGYRQPANWAVLYPDSVEQAWTVAYGISSPARSRDLMARLATAQPNWDRPTATATYWDGVAYPSTVDFWSVVGWAFDAVGNADRGAAGAAHIRDGAWKLNRQPPYTSGAQGALLLLESGGIRSSAGT
jgi:hypothetical protein